MQLDSVVISQGWLWVIDIYILGPKHLLSQHREQWKPSNWKLYSLNVHCFGALLSCCTWTIAYHHFLGYSSCTFKEPRDYPHLQTKCFANKFKTNFLSQNHFMKSIRLSELAAKNGDSCLHDSLVLNKRKNETLSKENNYDKLHIQPTARCLHLLASMMATSCHATTPCQHFIFQKKVCWSVAITISLTCDTEKCAKIQITEFSCVTRKMPVALELVKFYNFILSELVVWQ